MDRKILSISTERMVIPMTGLEEMKEAIEEESRLQCGKIEKQAQERLARIREDAQAAANARYQEILIHARKECENDLQRAKMGGEMETKRLLLRTKTEIVNETIEMALRHLRELPDADYFEVLTALAGTYACKGEGEMRLSERDLKRLPSGFADELNDMLAKQGAHVRIGAQPARIDGGFLLIYGDIEVNCSFEALLDASLEEIKDALSRELFA